MEADETELEFYQGINEGLYAAVLEKSFAKAAVFKYKNKFKNLYVSSEYAWNEPYFIRFVSEYDDIVMKTFIKVIRMTLESGLFDKWLKDSIESNKNYSQDDDSMMKSSSGQSIWLSRINKQLSYSIILLNQLSSIFKYLLFSMCFNTLILIIEIVYHLIKRKTR